MRVAALVTPYVLVVVVLGCDSTSAVPPAVVTDSAGVRIVDSSQPRLSGAVSWTRSADPVLEIGTTDGDPDYTLFQIRGALRLADARIVVANQGTNELRYFDPAGTFLLASGGSGSGPGEFQFLDAVWLGRADTVVVSDRANNRVSVFDSVGEFVRSFDVRPGPGATRPFKQGMLADGSIIASTVRRVGQRSRVGITRDSVQYLLYTPFGEFAQVVTTQAFLEFFNVILDGQQVFDMVPFSQPVVVALGQELVFVAPEKPFEVRGYGREGALEIVMRRAHTPVPVRGADRQAYRERALAPVIDEGERSQVERLLAEVPFAEEKPAIASALVDAKGYLWTETFDFPSASDATWSVFSPAGSWETELLLPANFVPYHIGADFILGVQRDEMDVERVVLYGLARHPTG
jgi:hypothetical protein